MAGKTPEEVSELAYRGVEFALSPNAAQRNLLESNAGAARFAYNWALDEIRGEYALWENDKSRKMGCTHYELRKRFNHVKDDIAPWWHDVSKEAFSYGCACAAAAWKNFMDSKRGRRHGRRVGFPRYKSRRQERNHRYAITTGIGHCVADAHHIRIPRIGRVRVMENIYKRITSQVIHRMNIRLQGGRWYVVLLIEVPENAMPSQSRKHVGIDLGVKNLATFSDGTVVRGLKPYRNAMRKLARAQRSLSRKTRGSKRYERQKRRVNRIYARVRGLRRNQLDQLTTSISERYSLVAIEDLNVSGMARNHRLARAISDEGFGVFRHMLEYKCRDRGVALVVADRWFPSSKTCSACGCVNAGLALSDRTYVCPECGLTIDRDLNAAMNLDRYGMSKVDSRAEDTLNARGGNASRSCDSSCADPNETCTNESVGA